MQALIRGTPEVLVRTWAGHVDWNMLKLYSHIADSDSQEAMKRLSNSEGKTPVSKEKEEKSRMTVQRQHNRRNSHEDKDTK